MSYEWFLIGITGAFFLGWIAARLDIRHIRKVATELPRAYLRGLSAIIAGNEEKALQHFLEAPVRNADPIEVQFAIAQLARRQGKFSQALTTHRNLFEREDLSPKQRNEALWELANDYDLIGFVDYAEMHLTPLLEDADHRELAFEKLLSLYQRQQKYSQAATLIESMGKNVLTMKRETVAQLYCQIAHITTDFNTKKQLLEKALTANPLCTRAILELAHLDLSQGNAKQACASYQKIEQLNPQQLWLAVENYVKACQRCTPPENFENTLLHWISDYPSLTLFKQIYQTLEQLNLDNDGILNQYLLERPHPYPASLWLSKQTDKKTTLWMTVEKILHQQAKKDFICTHCHYEVNFFTWECPCCLKWEKIKPSDL